MATVIGEVHTGQWNDWQQASRLNSSFGYGSPTNLGAIGMGAIGIAGDPYAAQGTLQSPQGYPNLGAIGIAGDPYEAQGTLQSPPGYPNLGAIGMGMLGGADLPQGKQHPIAAPARYMTKRQAELERHKMGLSPSRSAASAALARKRREAHACTLKLRRLANEYQTLQNRYGTSQAQLRQLQAKIHRLTQQLADAQQQVAHWRQQAGRARRWW